MYTADISVNELVADMPVSNPEVERKMLSLETSGLVQPLTVWAEGMRLIDGFHRLEAAKRLGWKTITCSVSECDEEAFWDARIQSARQHSGVERDRLLIWIAECWRASVWATKNNEPILMQIARMLYRLRKKRDIDFILTNRFTTALTENERAILEWFTTKAQKWDMEWPDLFDEIANRLRGVHRELGERFLAEKLARENELPLEQQLVIENALRDTGFGRRRGRHRIAEDDVATWVQDAIETKPLREYITEKNLEREKVRRSEEAQKAKERNAFLLTAEGQRQTREAVLTHLRGHWAQARHYLLYRHELLQSMADGPAIIGAEMLALQQVLIELWPGTDQPGACPVVVAENVRLRRDLAEEHEKRIAAELDLIDRADLEKRQAKIAEKLPEVMLWHSGR